MPIILHLDLNVDPSWQIHVGQGVNGLVGRINNIDQSFVNLHLKMLAGILVDVGRSSDYNNFSIRWKWGGARDFGSGIQGCLDNLRGRLVYDAVIKRF